MEVSGQLQASATLPPRKEFLIQTSGLQSRSESGKLQKILLGWSRHG